jgi:hypothetical protein
MMVLKIKLHQRAIIRWRIPTRRDVLTARIAQLKSQLRIESKRDTRKAEAELCEIDRRRAS